MSMYHGQRLVTVDENCKYVYADDGTPYTGDPNDLTLIPWASVPAPKYTPYPNLGSAVQVHLPGGYTVPGTIYAATKDPNVHTVLYAVCVHNHEVVWKYADMEFRGNTVDKSWWDWVPDRVRQLPNWHEDPHS